MTVLLTQSRGKEKLVDIFKQTGINVVKQMGEGVDLIVPLVDEELWFFSNSRDWFKSQGIIVATSPEFAVSTCRDKAEFYRFCRRHGFSIPETGQFEALVKPRFGKGSRGQFRIDRSMLVQEVITAPEYSIDYFRLGDKVSIIPRLRMNIVNGEAKDGIIVENGQLIDEAKRMGEELGLEYHNVMQCFFDGKSIKWLEVNCRYGGGSWLTFKQFNSPKYLVDTLREKV